jgi:hypothetical protein
MTSSSSSSSSTVTSNRINRIGTSKYLENICLPERKSLEGKRKCNEPQNWNGRNEAKVGPEKNAHSVLLPTIGER